MPDKEQEKDDAKAIQDLYNAGVARLPSDENAPDDKFRNIFLDWVDAHDEPDEED